MVWDALQTPGRWEVVNQAQMELIFLAFIGFAAMIPAANYLIGHFGACHPGGPCVIPVGFGLEAPSGVLMVGLALVLRDVIHERAGIAWAAFAIVVGALVSYSTSPAALVMASVTSFVFAEAADLYVYARCGTGICRPPSYYQVRLGQ
ncbi:hypothetical protein AMC79_CH03281 [Rhizobium phaseoli]|nr:hypothetical protein AMC79_CH03281 [Rhizobium phaseoli]